VFVYLHVGVFVQVAHLSGGEMQRVALVLALGKPADIYLIDEPSAYLDSEQRIVASKVIKRFVLCIYLCFGRFFRGDIWFEVMRKA
jgi:ATP-binding cassette subfamily E protein 1